jgi:pimeloyl-ACP methyl ester carboxylesterase
VSLFCLVHGSAQAPSGWDLLIPQLKKLGHETVCVDLPTDKPEARAAQYAQVIGESLKNSKEAAIAVATSASGMFLPFVPQYADIERIVFLAAVVPESGKSMMERFQAHPEMFNPDWVGKDPTRDPEVPKRFLFHDCDPDVAEWALTTLRLTYARAAMMEPCSLQRWPAVPSTYILCREDRTINPEWWRREAERLLGVVPLELPGGHCPHVSRPAELAAVLSALDR